MHIPDGFIDAGTSLGAGMVAAGGVGVAARKTAAALDDRGVPLAGLVAAFVFAVQMLNFPVAAGTSGHLLGGVLAAVLVGPWAGALCIAVVLGVQALFADGGITALGLNVVNMALVGGLGGYALFLALRKLTGGRRTAIPVVAGVAAGLSVVLAAGAFTVEYALGGVGGASVGAVAAAMTSVHALIGIGEGLITASTVATVLAVRPDLVHGARHEAQLDLRPVDVAVGR
jgi:cobalt/nickel transport system permease protein